MRKKIRSKTKQVVDSDMSEDNSLDGSTTHKAVLLGVRPIRVATL